MNSIYDENFKNCISNRAYEKNLYFIPYIFTHKICVNKTIHYIYIYIFDVHI